MSRFRVVVTDDRYGSYDEERKVLSEIGGELIVCNFESLEEAAAGLKGADGVLVNLFPMDSEIIGKLDSCKVISRYGVGYDNVAVDAAAEKGIFLCNVPDYSYEDVSDHALALLLGTIRMIPFKDRSIRSGQWNMQKSHPCYRIRGKTLGIIGYGMIGKAFHGKVSSLGLADVLVHDPYVSVNEITRRGGVSVDFDLLLTKSDYISLHAPCSDTTRGMMGGDAFSLMKKGAILVNTSRGGLIDEAALCKALDDRKLAAAGLDVFENEPLPEDSPLRRYETVILTDHSAYYSEESLTELKTKAARNIVEVLSGGTPTYAVNNPRTRLSNR